MKFIQGLRREFTGDMVGYLAIVTALTAIIIFFSHLPS